MIETKFRIALEQGNNGEVYLLRTHQQQQVSRGQRIRTISSILQFYPFHRIAAITLPSPPGVPFWATSPSTEPP
jgi:hypothetical protein